MSFWSKICSRSKVGNSILPFARRVLCRARDTHARAFARSRYHAANLRYRAANFYLEHSTKTISVVSTQTISKPMDAQNDISNWISSIPKITRFWFFSFFAVPLTTRLGLIDPMTIIMLPELVFSNFQVSNKP